MFVEFNRKGYGSGIVLEWFLVFGEWGMGVCWEIYDGNGEKEMNKGLEVRIGVGCILGLLC